MYQKISLKHHETPKAYTYEKISLRHHEQKVVHLSKISLKHHETPNDWRRRSATNRQRQKKHIKAPQPQPQQQPTTNNTNDQRPTTERNKETATNRKYETHTFELTLREEIWNDNASANNNEQKQNKKHNRYAHMCVHVRCATVQKCVRAIASWQDDTAPKRGKCKKRVFLILAPATSAHQ